MLSKNLTRKVTRNLWSAYSTQASPMVASGSNLPTQPQRVTKLDSGVTVMTVESYAPVSSLTFAYKSGLRYENARNAGVSQKLKICAGLKTKEHSAFMNIRRPPQIGAKLFCNVGRETMSYGVSGVIRNDLDTWFSHAYNMAAKPLFRRWEVEECIPRIALLNDLDPEGRAVDLMHTGAFHLRGLGNQWLIPDYNNDEITDYELRNFWSDTHSLDRLVVLGYGMDHEDLAFLVEDIDTDASGNIAETPTKYFGGETRKETDAPYAYVALGGQGVSISSTKEADALTLAKCILGVGKNVKYGDIGGAKLMQGLSKAGCSGTASSFSYNYSDAGIFGFTLVETAEKAGDAVRAAAKVVRSLKVSEDDLKSAKIKAKAGFLQELETKASLVNYSANNLLFTQNVRSPDQFSSDIASITAEDVQKVLSKVTSSKPCMGAYGGISNVPYLDEF